MYPNAYSDTVYRGLLEHDSSHCSPRKRGLRNRGPRIVALLTASVRTCPICYELLWCFPQIYQYQCQHQRGAAAFSDVASDLVRPFLPLSRRRSVSPCYISIVFSLCAGRISAIVGSRLHHLALSDA